MTQDDAPRFGVALVACAEMFDKEISAALVKLYYESLKDLTIVEVERGLARAISASNFMPRPAQIREYAGLGSINAKQASSVAWHRLLAACSEVGCYRSIEIEDPATAFAVEQMGGWVAVCTRDDETHWVEREFRELYESYRGPLVALPRLFPGIHEGGDNTAEGRLRAAETRARLSASGEIVSPRPMLPRPGENREGENPRTD